MGCKKRMKKGVIPHKFECQENRKCTVPELEDTSVLKRRKLDLSSECLESTPCTSANITFVKEEHILEEDTQTFKICGEALDEPLKKDIGVQAFLKPSFRSKSIQCTLSAPITCDSCSPMAIERKDEPKTPIQFEQVFVSGI